MKRKPVTLSDDLGHLVAGAIQMGEFSNRSSAIRACVREYFSENAVATAALIVSNNQLEVEEVAEVLDVSQERLMNLVSAIDPSVAPTEPTSYLAEIEAEFPSMSRDETNTQASVNESTAGGEDENLSDGESDE